jgi:hypothetical protein
MAITSCDLLTRHLADLALYKVIGPVKCHRLVTHVAISQ